MHGCSSCRGLGSVPLLLSLAGLVTTSADHGSSHMEKDMQYPTWSPVPHEKPNYPEILCYTKAEDA